MSVCGWVQQNPEEERKDETEREREGGKERTL